MVHNVSNNVPNKSQWETLNFQVQTFFLIASLTLTKDSASSFLQNSVEGGVSGSSNGLYVFLGRREKKIPNLLPFNFPVSTFN